jgi:hypothetical protein
MATQIAQAEIEKVPSDEVINPSRGRLGRFICLASYIPLAGFAAKAFTYNLATMPFTNEAGEVTNKLVDGLASGSSWIAAIAVLGISIPKWFLISNDPNRMFVTQNTLASFFGAKQIDVAYGPGLHPCYPWEKRIEGNNISLDEATVEFDFTITLEDGSLSGKGAYWLRPDHTDPVRFLRGVASVGEEIKTLIIAEIQDYVASDDFRNERISANDTSRITQLVNKRLEALFGDNDDTKKQAIERRNAVIISNAAVESVQISGDLSKTVTGIAEARAIQKATAILLGFADSTEMAEALKKGLINQDDISRARRDVLSISGNLEGMTVNRQEYALDVRGLTPELLDVIGQVLKTPAARAAAIAAAARMRGGGNTEGKKK